MKGDVVRKDRKEKCTEETRAYEILMHVPYKVNQTQLWFHKCHEAVV